MISFQWTAIKLKNIVSIYIIDDSLILYYNIVKSYYLVSRLYGQPV